MLAYTLRPIATTVKTAAVMPDYATGDVVVNLPPLADGTPVEGIVSDGRPLGVHIEWRDRIVSVDFTEAATPYIEIDENEQLFPAADWGRRRKVMADLLTNNIVEQVVERAKAWQPQLFN